MRKMESKDKTKCFICCNIILNPEDCSFQETVDVNVLVIFMLRNLLDIPKSLCENLLSRKGNPSDWILCCPFCVSLTRQAQTIFRKKMELEQKFDELKSKIRATASHQWRLFSEIPNEKHKNDFPEEIIRNIFLNHAVNEENSQIVLKLDADEYTTFIKEDAQCFVDDTFEENSLNDSFLLDNDNTSVACDDDMIGDNCDQIEDNPLLQPRLEKGNDNTSEKLEKEKCINPCLETVPKKEINTDFDPNDPYVCGDCGQRFLYIRKRELHQRRYQNNPNKCVNKFQKQNHQKIVKREKEVEKSKYQKKVKCGNCNELFKTRTRLTAHQDRCHTQEVSNVVSANSNLQYEENVQDIKLGDFTNIGDSDNLNSLPSDSKTAETEINDKDIVTKVEKGKTIRRKRAKKAVARKNKKTLDSDSDYSPEDDSDFEMEAFDGGSSDSDMSDSEMKKKPIKQKKEGPTERRIPKRLSKLISLTSEFPFKCDDCEMSFQYSHMQKLHRLNMHNVEMQCEQCDSKFETRQGWTIHCQKNHPDVSYPGVRFRPYEKSSMKCPICGELLQPGSIKVHLEGHKSISCYICSKPFTTRHKLKRHQRKYHHKECNLIPIQCLECEKTFATRGDLGQHMISKHTKEYPESCPICSVGVLNLKQHIQRIHTEAKPFVCSFCGKGYWSKGELETHETIKHTKNFKFTCEVCGKQFAKNHALVKHTLLHQDFPKPFVCELCGDSFRDKNKLKYHQRGQHYKELNLQPFKCLQCDIVYTCSAGLRNHNIRVHKEAANEQVCAECGKKLTNLSTLQDHIRRHHTGEKIFGCSLCDKRYFSKKSLEKHVQRYHTKDFSFKCTLCPLGYSDSWSFNRHLKLIHGQDKDAL